MRYMQHWISFQLTSKPTTNSPYQTINRRKTNESNLIKQSLQSRNVRKSMNHTRRRSNSIKTNLTIRKHTPMKSSHTILHYPPHALFVQFLITALRSVHPVKSVGNVTFPRHGIVYFHWGVLMDCLRSGGEPCRFRRNIGVGWCCVSVNCCWASIGSDQPAGMPHSLDRSASRHSFFVVLVLYSIRGEQRAYSNAHFDIIVVFFIFCTLFARVRLV